MAEKTYIVLFKPPESTTQTVQASSAETVDGYLVFRGEDGELRGLFHLEVVESWWIERPAN